MAKIPGTFKQDIFPLVTERSPEQIAALIAKRYKKLFGKQEGEPEEISTDISRILRYAPPS